MSWVHFPIFASLSLSLSLSLVSVMFYIKILCQHHVPFFPLLFVIRNQLTLVVSCYATIAMSWVSFPIFSSLARQSHVIAKFYVTAIFLFFFYFLIWPFQWQVVILLLPISWVRFSIFSSLSLVSCHSKSLCQCLFFFIFAIICFMSF